MPSIRSDKGKKRAVPASPMLDQLVVFASEPPHPTKRRRKAETRPCPVCDELIPLRLLAKHAELEDSRLSAIMQSISSPDLQFVDVEEPGSSRRSAVKARRTLTSRGAVTSVDQSEKTIQAVVRNRKQRIGKMKEMVKEEEDGAHAQAERFTGQEIVCPVCSVVVRGDEDVVDAHVDACIAYESLRLEEARQQELHHQRQLEEAAWEDTELHQQYAGNMRGAGFYTRNRNEGDVEEDVDIDGDDQAVYGEAQFTEDDVVPLNPRITDEDEEVDVEAEDSRSPSHRPQPPPVNDTDTVDIAIANARRTSDTDALVKALEQKVRQMASMAHRQGECRADEEQEEAEGPAGSSCRICLDPYTEPTVSTGCWHTCCRECWLRCLGTTKLCPICKRITCTTELRRIYL